jgi:hypothetical protein
MPMATIHKVGQQGELYHIHFLDSGHPDQGLPGGGGRPDQGLPGGGMPPHVGGQPPPHVGNRPPGSGGGGIPDHELPDTPPPQVAPGFTLVLIRGPQGRWQYAVIAPGSPPPRPLPPLGGGGHPDQGLPGQPPQAGQGPGFPTPPMAPGGQPPQPSQPPMPGTPPMPGGQPTPQHR